MFQKASAFIASAHRRIRVAVVTQFVIGVVIAVANVVFVVPVLAAAQSPVVTPATGGGGVPIAVGSFTDVDAINYEEAEFFLSGTAHAYTSPSRLTADGKWSSIAEGPTTAAYKTRAIVFMPKDKSKFNGTVYVEWLNVSGTADASPDWVHSHIEVARQGAAYVLASAQSAGIKTLKSSNPWWVPAVPYAVSDAVRYASLKHPGDSYSYDIYSQIGQAVWDGGLLGELQAQSVIALGESQSAFRLTTYINAVQPLVNVYDGFIVHSTFGAGAALNSLPRQHVAGGFTIIRDDLHVPVLTLMTETDVSFSFQMARQDEEDSGNFRLWEIPGTAHYDSYGLEIGTIDTGAGEGEVMSLEKLRNPNKAPTPGIMECANGINAGPAHWVINAAMHWINLWVKDGISPPIAPRIETLTQPGLPVVFNLDEHGNVLGGIRTPFLDAPVATLSGGGNGAAENAPLFSAFCGLFGQTIPFTDEKLLSLYPSHDVFVEKFRAATDAAVSAGFLLPEDALKLNDAAESTGKSSD